MTFLPQCIITFLPNTIQCNTIQYNDIQKGKNDGRNKERTSYNLRKKMRKKKMGEKKGNEDIKRRKKKKSLKLMRNKVSDRRTHTRSHRMDVVYTDIQRQKALVFFFLFAVGRSERPRVYIGWDSSFLLVVDPHLDLNGVIAWFGLSSLDLRKKKESVLSSASSSASF